MNVPNIECKIEAVCAVNLSESPDRVKAAITNIFLDCAFKDENYSIMATGSIESFESIREVIQSRQSQKTYRRILEKNRDGKSTWFYLNKQAAFVKKVATCENADESPLGPIKVILTSDNIEGIIEWIANRKD